MTFTVRAGRRWGGVTIRQGSRDAGDRTSDVLLVTNVLTHYRAPLYRMLSRTLPARLIFFSDGLEPYWGKGNRPLEDLPGRVLPGRWIGRTRIPRGLLGAVVHGDHDVVVKCLNGKAALPLTYAAARLSRRRFVLWTGVWQHPQGRMHQIGRPLVRHIYRNADAVLTYGRHVSRHVVDEGARPDRVVVAVQAVDLELFSLGGPAEVSEPDVLDVLYVGRFEPAKGPQVLLEAWRAVADTEIPARLTFVGSGPLRESLEARVADLGLTGSVRVLGPRENAELPSLYRSAAVTVVPSLLAPDFAEPWSLAVNEAMGCGSVVIASTAVGAVRDGLVDDGSTGLTFPWGDDAALSDALLRALTSVELRDRLAAAGHAAVQSYSFEHAAAGFRQAVGIARRRPSRSVQPPDAEEAAPTATLERFASC